MNVDSIYGRPEFKEELYVEREHIARWLVQGKTTLPSPLQFHLHLGLYITLCTSGAQIKARFQALLQECAENWPENETTIIFDGAPPRRPAQTPAEPIELRILPPYSPFLNRVENAISALKVAIKCDISRPMVQQQMNDRLRAQQENIPLGEYRKRVLLAAAERNIATITVPKCNAWFRHMQTYLPRCLNGEFVEGYLTL